MDRERIKAVFGEALDLPAGERGAYVRARLAREPEAAAEVLALLDAEARSGGFLAQPVLGASPFTSGPGAGGSDPLPAYIGGYRIRRLVAEGGMGMVYEGIREAEGFEHRVALKLVRRGMESGPILERFLAERAILSRLDHPHIARLFDGGATAEGLPYFVMEFIDGLPIHEHCRRYETTLRERVRLVRDAARAVEYAHARKVLHRDLKPGNVLVTAGGVVKVVDFGVARAIEEGPQRSHTATLFRIVTPDYASPEQLSTGRADARSDVYGLGVLLYEILTGAGPREFLDRGRGGAGKAPGGPKPPSHYRRDVPAGLDWIVLRAIEPEARHRFASVSDFIRQLNRWLEGRTVLGGPRLMIRRIRIALGNRMVATSLVLSTALAGGVLLGTYWGKPAPAGGANRAGQVLAVSGFRNLAKDPANAWIAAAAEEVLTSELAGASSLRLVPAEEVSRLRSQAGRASGGLLPVEAWREVGARYVLRGSYVSSGARPDSPIRLDARITDHATGEDAATLTETGSQAELASLLTRLARRIAEHFGETGDRRPGRYPRAEALRLLGSGLERLEAYDPLAARMQLERAAALDPGNGRIRWALARTLGELGYGAKAREEAQRALAGGGGPRALRLRMEAFECRAGGDRDCVLSRYVELEKLEPGNQAVLHELATAYNAAGDAARAEQTLSALRERGGASSVEAALAELEMAQARGDSARLRKAAERLRTLARERGSSLLLARALHTLAVCELQIAEYGAAERLLRQAVAEYGQSGYRLGTLRAGGTRASAAMSRGDAEGAAGEYAKLAEAAREIGHVAFEGQSLANAAAAWVRAGKPDRAMQPAGRRAGRWSSYGRAWSRRRWEAP